MKSKSLPAHIVAALKHKRELERCWKSLSSSVDYDHVAVSAAENAFVRQKELAEDLFASLAATKRLEDFGVDELGGNKACCKKF